MPDNKSNLRELRILVHRRGTLFRVCKLVFSRQDVSLYLVPYAVGRRYFCGGSDIPEHVVSRTFKFTEGAASDREPKLSIHESGQVHVQASGALVGIVHTLPLETLRGQHMATICLDDFNGLSPFTGTPRDSGAEREFIFMVGDELASGRLALYINGSEPSFAANCLLTLTLNRPTLASPLFVGIRPITQEKLGEPHRSGVTIIAGWNPLVRDSERLDYVYLRGD